MKAIQVPEPGEMELIDKPLPEISSSEDVLVKVEAVGICGSDMHIFHGTSPVAVYPRVLGHEVVGSVVATGSDVTDLSLGDHVVLDPIEYCGTCYACRLGRGNVCQTLKVRGVHVDGGFQEYFCVSAENLHRIPAEISFPRAVMIEPYTIGYQAVWRGGVLSGDLVLIYGARPDLWCSTGQKGLVQVALLQIFGMTDSRWQGLSEQIILSIPGRPPLKSLLTRFLPGWGLMLSSMQLGSLQFYQRPYTLHQLPDVWSPWDLLIILQIFLYLRFPPKSLAFTVPGCRQKNLLK